MLEKKHKGRKGQRSRMKSSLFILFLSLIDDYIAYQKSNCPYDKLHMKKEVCDSVLPLPTLTVSRNNL